MVITQENIWPSLRNQSIGLGSILSPKSKVHIRGVWDANFFVVDPNKLNLSWTVTFGWYQLQQELANMKVCSSNTLFCAWRSSNWAS